MSCVLSPLIAFMIFSFIFYFQLVDHDAFISGFLCMDSAWGSLTLDWFHLSIWGNSQCYYLVNIFVLFYLSYASEIPIIFMLNCLLLFHRAYMLSYGFHFFLFMFQLCFRWPVCYQVYWFFYYVQSVDKPIKIILHF